MPDLSLERNAGYQMHWRILFLDFPTTMCYCTIHTEPPILKVTEPLMYNIWNPIASIPIISFQDAILEPPIVMFIFSLIPLQYLHYALLPRTYLTLRRAGNCFESIDLVNTY